MRGLKARMLLVAVVATAMVLMMAGSAFAAVHVTNRAIVTAGEVDNITVESTGDAGQNHGNLMEFTSPVLPSPPDYFFWYNQDVTATDFELVDPDADADLLFTRGLYNTGGADTPFTDPLVVSAQGVYNLTVVGTEDDGDTTYTVPSAFGIDKTAPNSSSDAVPVYGGGTATINISATDALSGVEDVRYSMDGGPWDYDFDAVVGTTVVPVTFNTPGTHTLWWRTCDNAGNEDFHSVTFIVRPSGFVPTVTLGVTMLRTGKNGSHIEHHKARFSGNVSPMPTDMPLQITVQRWNGHIWKFFTSFTITVPKYAGSYSVTKSFSKDGKYRALAQEGGGLSSWKRFTVN